jgi:hypothetical protein
LLILADLEPLHIAEAKKVQPRDFCAEQIGAGWGVPYPAN